jgi:uncharacterized membrane protein/quercetin dioxygenase-like cupin family protein
MRTLADGDLPRHAIAKFGSLHAYATPLARAPEAGVTRIELRAGGRLGRHPAATDQLLVVVAGEAIVSGGDGVAVRVGPGGVVLWVAGEEHETTTDTGVTAIVVEAAGIAQEYACRARFATPTADRRRTMHVAATSGRAAAAPRAPGILLGIGLGGFVDGILLHQILQWHHMLSSEPGRPTTTVAGLEANTLADGLFHAAAWLVVVAGLWLLWRRSDEWRWAASGRALIGWILVGFGAFNLVEGIVDHELLGLHHVREHAGHQTAYDAGFLALSGVVLAAGWVLARRGELEPA